MRCACAVVQAQRRRGGRESAAAGPWTVVAHHTATGAGVQPSTHVPCEVPAVGTPAYHSSDSDPISSARCVRAQPGIWINTVVETGAESHWATLARAR